LIQIPYIQGNRPFPDVSEATEDGLLAYGGDLKPERLILAYRSGIFPWYGRDEPILWWAPNPRLVLYLDEFKLRKSLKKRFKHFEVRYDTAFTQVINSCSYIPRKGQMGTWLVPEMIDAYQKLFHRGYAHSVEAWQGNNLVGGLYGIAIGKMFFGESMFAKVSDASKVAFAHLVERLKDDGYELIDCQVATEHLKSLGAREISRDLFMQQMSKKVQEETVYEHWNKNIL
jgi:leucyl/phenylalanyl-tRNA--protein transferase